jgi:hypothetical protein
MRTYTSETPRDGAQGWGMGTVLSDADGYTAPQYSENTKELARKLRQRAQENLKNGVKMEYMVAIDYPYSWAQGYTARFDTEEEARAYATDLVSRNSPSGTEGFQTVRVYKQVVDLTAGA